MRCWILNYMDSLRVSDPLRRSMARVLEVHVWNIRGEMEKWFLREFDHASHARMSFLLPSNGKHDSWNGLRVPCAMIDSVATLTHTDCVVRDETVNILLRDGARRARIFNHSAIPNMASSPRSAACGIT